MKFRLFLCSFVAALLPVAALAQEPPSSLAASVTAIKTGQYVVTNNEDRLLVGAFQLEFAAPVTVKKISAPRGWQAAPSPRNWQPGQALQAIGWSTEDPSVMIKPHTQLSGFTLTSPAKKRANANWMMVGWDTESNNAGLVATGQIVAPSK